MSTKGTKITEKPKNTVKTIKRLLGTMKGSSVLIFIAIGISVFGTVAMVIAPKILGNASTLIYSSVKSGLDIDMNKLMTILITTMLLYVVQFVCMFLQTRFMTVTAQRTAANLRSGLKEKMSKVPVSFFDKNANGNLMSIAVNDTDNVANSIQQSLVEFTSNVITIVGMIIIMLVISWKLTLIAVVMIPLTTIVMKFFLPKMQKNMREFLGKQGELNTHIEESYIGHSIIKCNNGEAGAVKTFDKTNDVMYESGWKAAFSGAFMFKIILSLKNLIYVLIAIIGAIFVSQGSLSIGDMQAFLMYAVLFSAPVTRLGMIFTEIVTGVSSAERIFEILDAEEMEKITKQYKNKPHKSEVSFSHVQFGYDEKILMKDFSLDVYNGQMIAIVGHTGAGKTTLINLLEGFYEVQNGSIYVEGIDIRNMGKSNLRKKIGMVLQDTWLFSGTIYDNIKYGNENASYNDVIEAAEAAFVDDFVRTLPEGYDTVLNEDASNISQGQRQLITIARAFIANPEILILDEATSNVDSRTEMLIQGAIKKLLVGRTSFVIAHRLSTIYGADNIIVMSDGDIVEQGRHEQLVNAKGVYSDIYNSQFATS